MRHLRYFPFTAGAAGLLYGLVYPNISCNRRFLISAAKPLKLQIDAVVSKDVEEYVNKLTPMMKHGFPSYDTLRIKRSFILSYDRRHRNPNWVMEHLTSDMVNEKTSGSRKESKFHEDETVHSYFRATLDDYRDSGYDRGHLAAAANHKYCQPALDDTFILSNIAPQNGYFNQGTWKTLERHVRNLTRKFGNVYICSGPLYLPSTLTDFRQQFNFELDMRILVNQSLFSQIGEIHSEKDEIAQFLEGQPNKRKRKKIQVDTHQKKTRKYVIYEVIGENNVAVPTHFFKIIVIEVGSNKYDMEAYIVPNESLDSKEPLSSYMVPRNTIERAAGFLLFPHLPSNIFRFINGEESTEN